MSFPEVYGDEEGEVLLVGWGSTWGPIRETVVRLRDRGVKIGMMHFRHLNPMPNGIDQVFARFEHVLAVEMNDEGLYGFGQLATLLRARYCDSKIQSLCKTDGLTFKIREIIEKIDAITS